MMKFIVSAIAVFVSTAAQAAVTGPLWLCHLDASASGYSVGLGLNITKIDGNGYITCTRAETQENVEVPVKVSIDGVGLGLGVSKVSQMDLFTFDVGVTSYKTMIGKFTAGAEANATVFSGAAGVQIGIRSNNGLALELGMTAADAKGLNVKVGGFALKVKQAGAPVYTSWN